MKKGKLELTNMKDVIYWNNKGNPFLLTEATSPINPETYDIIVAFSGEIKEDGCFSWRSYDVFWWFGAYSIKCYLEDSDESILEDCAYHLDEY